MRRTTPGRLRAGAKGRRQASRKEPNLIALVTGFEPYAGHRINPSAEIARRLDGATIAGVRVVGRVLPVEYGRIRAALVRVLAELPARPAAVIALGLAVGEPVIRLERRTKRPARHQGQ